MKDTRKSLYESYYSDFKEGEKRERLGPLHLKLWYDEKYLPLLKQIPREAPVLEIGCGAGLMLNYLRRSGFTNIRGIDISAEQVAQAVAKGFDAKEADALQYLSEHKLEYDAIVAMDVIEHFRKDELLELLNAVRLSLRPSGVFIIQTPNGEGLLPNYVIYGDFTHYTIVSPLSLKHILTVAGFSDIRMKELGPGALVHFPLFVAWQLVRLGAMLVKFVEIGRIQKYWTESFICWCRKPA